MSTPAVLGIVGWSGSGKTTLITRLIPLLVKRGLKVATLKHAHHNFDVDKPGKDSYEHRKAGASEVIISSDLRWVQMHELQGDAAPSLGQLLRRLSPCDVVLIEGHKGERHRKIEIFREAVGQPPLYPEDPNIIAVASDRKITGRVAFVDLNDIEAVANLVCETAEPLESLLDRLD